MRNFLRGLMCVTGLTFLGAALASWLVEEAENQLEEEKNGGEKA